MFISPAKRLGEVKEYYFSIKLREIAEMNARGKEVINLGIGSPDLPPSQVAIDELTQQSKHRSNHAYQSYKGIPELRQAFASWYQEWFNVSLDPDSEILPLIGSKEGIMHISMSFLEAGDEVLVPNPGYPAYRAVTLLTGANIIEYDLEADLGWLPDLKQLEKKDLSKVKIMWTNYPNMPTGAKANISFFEKLIQFANRHQILICNDNPYAFILNDTPLSLLAVPGAREVAIELNSMSKSHNMAGWRVGMMAGASEHLQTILRFKSNMDSGMYRPIQLAAAKALQNPPEWYKNLNSVYKERRNKVFEMLDLLDCQYTKEQVGMFVWAKIPGNYTSGFQLSDEVLHNSNVFITPGGIFGPAGEQYIRISLCSDGQLFDEAIRRIAPLTGRRGFVG